MIDAPLAIAFASGMLAPVNPCGFAMLPAYLGFFLGQEGGDRDVRASVSRSLGVGLSVSAGFLLVFSIVGLAIYHLSASFSSAERRVGEECVSTGRSRWSTYH